MCIRLPASWSGKVPISDRTRAVYTVCVSDCRQAGAAKSPHRTGHERYILYVYQTAGKLERQSPHIGPDTSGIYCMCIRLPASWSGKVPISDRTRAVYTVCVSDCRQAGAAKSPHWTGHERYILYVYQTAGKLERQSPHIGPDTSGTSEGKSVQCCPRYKCPTGLRALIDSRASGARRSLWGGVPLDIWSRDHV
ncbi:hypothetical protein J6590_011260 [Homalodisca vitripennis]|nr:hypothetical protein J6590_011260 [Homalodisca vitripennis]